MNKVVYLAHYDKDSKRRTSPAGVALMDYMIDCLGYLQCGEIHVLSVAESKDDAYMTDDVVDRDDGVCVHFIPSLKRANKLNLLGRFIRRIRQIRLAFNQINEMIDDGDTLIAYHSLALVNIIKRLRKNKNFKLVLQVAEIYADVLNDKKKRKKEIKFIKSADSYVFQTEMLNQLLNADNKPYAILYGTYRAELDRKTKFNDDKIHVVYAGTFDPRKGGALSAVASAKHLDEKYHLHILGFGTDEDKNNLLSEIQTVSKQTKCNITYDGLLLGEEYIRFIQSCDIGLSTQNQNAVFNNTSFPSKILSYMSNGLRVVSVRIPVVEISSVNPYMSYYDHPNPLDIAKAIKNVEFMNQYDGQTVLKNLDKQFKASLFDLLNI